MVDTVVKILIILAQESARVIAGRVDYDKAVVVAVLANIFESGDYVEFPFFQRAIDKFFKEDGIFGHGRWSDEIERQKGRKFYFYPSSSRDNINGFGYEISEASLGHIDKDE